MTVQERFDWIFDFGLTERCPYTSIENPNSIQLKTQVDDDCKSQYITGFSILIRDSTEEEAENKVDRQAKVLTDIISVKRERYTGYYPTGQSMIRPDMTRRVTGKRTIRYNILKDLKLSLKECRIAASIKNDLPQNQQFYHASLGLRASEFELYDVMIIEFYKVIEVDRNILSNECKKYEPLRDVLSHPDEIRPETRERLKN
jgi:hypothetical protein